MALTAGGASLPAFTSHTRLLVVAPHPDDETLANGVLLQQVLAAGGAVRVLLLTDGENNPWPQRWVERRWRIDDTARRRWAQRRRAELDAALHALGVAGTALEALSWSDLGVFDRVRHPTLGAVPQLQAVLTRYAPDVIALPALGDRHPDHGAAHVLMRQAIAAWGGAPSVLTYLIHGARDVAPAATGTATPSQHAAKQRAVAAHHSQLVLSRRRMRRWGGRDERHEVQPPAPANVPRRLPWRPLAFLRRRLWLTLVAERGAVGHWRWNQAPLVRDAQGWYLTWPDAEAAGTCFAHLSLEVPSPWIFDHWGWREI